MLLCRVVRDGRCLVVVTVDKRLHQMHGTSRTTQRRQGLRSLGIQAQGLFAVAFQIRGTSRGGRRRRDTTTNKGRVPLGGNLPLQDGHGKLGHVLGGHLALFGRQESLFAVCRLLLLVCLGLEGTKDAVVGDAMSVVVVDDKETRCAARVVSTVVKGGTESRMEGFIVTRDSRGKQVDCRRGNGVYSKGHEQRRFDAKMQNGNGKFL